MLKDIIISRVRIKMITLFLLNPGKIYHVRDIVRKLGEEINAVRRELARMEKAGMVSKERRANRLYYLFRKDYPLYGELLQLVHKTSGLGGVIQKNKNKLGKLKLVMLSGKYARKLPRSQNDVDLLVVGTVVLPELANMIRGEEVKTGREINYTVMSEEEFNFRKRRRDPFILSILSRSRIMIIGDEEDLVKKIT